DLITRKLEHKTVLVLDKSEWDRIRGHIQLLHKDAEYEEKQMLWEKLKEKSIFMVKDWEKTIQNERERREAGNNTRLEPIDKRKTNEQKALRVEQETEKREYLAKCQRAQHYNKHDIKILNQSLRFSEILRIQEAQIIFNKKLKAQEEKKEKEYAEKCRKDAQEYTKQKQVEEKERAGKILKNKEDLLAQIKEKEEKKLNEEQEKEREREDMINIKKEIETAEKCADHETAKKKKIFRQQINDYFDKQEEFNEKKKHTEDLEERLIEIYRISKQKIEKMQKQKEHEVLHECLKRKEKITDQLVKLQQKKGDYDSTLIQRAAAENEVTHKWRMKKLAYEHCLKEERKKAYEEFLQQKAQSKKDEEKLRKREMIQRLKEVEINCRFYKAQHEKYIKTTQEMRKTYQKQTKEREDGTRRDREEGEKLVKHTTKMYEEDDKSYLKYADEIIQDSTKKGRYLYPILHAREEEIGIHYCGYKDFYTSHRNPATWNTVKFKLVCTRKDMDLPAFRKLNLQQSTEHCLAQNLRK
ncbi:hypothetical protein Cfor_03219, partial [Coptotermes formosanus]